MANFDIRALPPIQLYQETQEQTGAYKDIKELKTGAGQSVWIRGNKITIGSGNKIIGLNNDDGIYLGNEVPASAPFWVNMDGDAILNSVLINGRDGADLAAAINADANLITNIINSKLDTSSQQILAGFDFGSTNYAGAVKTGDIAWNVSTGAIVSGSGVVVYRSGIVGANGGVVKFSIGIDGNAYFAGTVAGINGTFGTITAGSITGVSFSGGTITGTTFSGGTFSGGTFTGATIQTASSGYRVVLTSGNGIGFYNSGTELGKIQADASGDIHYYSADDHVFATNGTDRWQITNGEFVPRSNNAYNIGTDPGSGGKAVKNIFAYKYYAGSNGTGGATGSFKDYNNKTITVIGGIITNIAT